MIFGKTEKPYFANDIVRVHPLICGCDILQLLQAYLTNCSPTCKFFSLKNYLLGLWKVHYLFHCSKQKCKLYTCITMAD